MKSLTDRLLEIKDKLAPLLQPITEAELYLLLHPQRKHEITSSVGVDEPSNPGLLAHQQLLVGSVLTQWSANTAYDDLLRRVLTSSNSCHQLLCQLSEKENIVQNAQRVLIRKYAQPCLTRFQQLTDLQMVTTALEKTGIIRNQLQSLRKSLVDPNKRIRILLAKKRGLQSYLRLVKQAKEVIGEISFNGYAYQQLESIRQRLKDQRLQHYSFSKGLKYYLQNQIEGFTSYLAQKISMLMSEYNEEDVSTLAQSVLRLNEDQANELPSIVARASKQTIKRELATISATLNCDVNAIEVSSLMKELSSEKGIRFLAHLLLSFEKLWNNGKQIIMIVCGEQWETECTKVLQDVVRSFIHTTISEAKPLIFSTKPAILPIVDLLMVFANQILQCHQLWTDLSTLFRSWLEYQQGQVVSQVDADLESEEWKIVDGLNSPDLLPQLSNFIQTRFQLDYNTQLQLLAAPTATDQPPQTLPKKVGMIFSMFNSLRCLESRLFYLVMMLNCGDEYHRILACDYSLVIKFYLMNLIGLLGGHSAIKHLEQLKMTTRMYFPHIFNFIEKNSRYIFRREDHFVEPTEAIVSAIKDSLAVFKACIEPHRQLVTLLRQDCVLNQYLSELNELPEFLELLAVMVLAARVDLSDFDNERWYSEPSGFLFESFLDSLKWQYCRLRKPGNQKLFLEKVEVAIIDKISAMNINRKQLSRALSSYEQIEKHLKEAGIQCGSNVQNYLTARITKDNDHMRLTLARSKLAIFTARSLFSLVKDKQQAEDLRKQYKSMTDDS